MPLTWSGAGWESVEWSDSAPACRQRRSASVRWRRRRRDCGPAGRRPPGWSGGRPAPGRTAYGGWSGCGCRRSGASADRRCGSVSSSVHPPGPCCRRRGRAHPVRCTRASRYRRRHPPRSGAHSDDPSCSVPGHSKEPKTKDTSAARRGTGW